MGVTFTGTSQDRSDGIIHSPARARARATPIDRWLVARVQRTIDPVPVRLVLWDDSSPYTGADPPIGDLVLHDRRALLGLAVHPDLWFGESYMRGGLEVRGPLEPVLEALSQSPAAEATWRERVHALFSRTNTLISARRNVHHHYDLGNDFYRLWLDGDMVYTCAYFPAPDAALEEAQRAKLDLVCRKLRLRKGESVVEAGCGWGALALHMAKHYGVYVKAFNVSREQLAYARARAQREGLSGRVEFIDDDYRNVTGKFDAFVSVGMLEHVGRAQFEAVAAVLRRSVHRAGGRGLLHFIGRDTPRPVNAWIRRRIFPGGYTPTLAEVTSRVLGPAGMSAIDVENLRLHYACTLKHWASRFAGVHDQVRSVFGEEFRRAWELYLAGSQAAFASGALQLFQVVFVPCESPPPYWTRNDPHHAERCGDSL